MGNTAGATTQPPPILSTATRPTSRGQRRGRGRRRIIQLRLVQLPRSNPHGYRRAGTIQHCSRHHILFNHASILCHQLNYLTTCDGHTKMHAHIYLYIDIYSSTPLPACFRPLRCFVNCHVHYRHCKSNELAGVSCRYNNVLLPIASHLT